MKINKIKLPIAITTYIIILGTFNVLQGFFSTFSPGSIVDMVNNTGLRLEGEGANTIIWL